MCKLLDLATKVKGDPPNAAELDQPDDSLRQEQEFKSFQARELKPKKGDAVAYRRKPFKPSREYDPDATPDVKGWHGGTVLEVRGDGTYDVIDDVTKDRSTRMKLKDIRVKLNKGHVVTIFHDTRTTEVAATPTGKKKQAFQAKVVNWTELDTEGDGEGGREREGGVCIGPRGEGVGGSGGESSA